MKHLSHRSGEQVGTWVHMHFNTKEHQAAVKLLKDGEPAQLFFERLTNSFGRLIQAVIASPPMYNRLQSNDRTS